MIEINNAPSIFGETKDRRSKYVGLDALKDSHVSFNGYGIAEDEIITFPTRAEFDKNPGKYIKQIPTYEKSPNNSALFLVDRNGRTGWFNLSTLTRAAYEPDPQNPGEYTRVDIDDFRKEMRLMNDDKERVEFLFGKQLKGGAPELLWAPEFGRDANDTKTYRKPTGNYKENVPYVTITVADIPADVPTEEVVEAPAKKSKK